MLRCADDDRFARSRDRFEEVVGFLDGEGAAGLTHAELEDRLDTDGRELLRLLFQDHLDLRSRREEPLEEVVGADGVVRCYSEAGHARTLETVFGEVTVTRMAYRRKGQANLHPADGALNLPGERYSHGLRRLSAVEASRGSFDEAVEAVDRASGGHVPKRQAEQLARRAAVDFDAFYAQRPLEAADPGDVLVISVDGKGIVMLPGALRKATADAAARSAQKLTSRLSKGEKRGRKRMAEVGAVYDVTPVPRGATDIIGGGDDKAEAPTANNKWLTASVVEDAATVIASVFDEAQRRDPHHQRTWVALVDGNNHQISRIEAEAAARSVELTVLVDVVHVLEYLWSAAWSFFAEGDAAAESWVADKALSVLEGNASTVAASIRRKATRLGLDAATRKNADTCADYLLAKRDYLDYPLALTKGWPIATGVIEGACRHLVKDRMDITGARWGLEGAEAVLRLRALRANRDFDHDWSFHIAMERRRVHESRYHDRALPLTA
ncbi:MAG: ISKra4 family transposase [Acidimicrobiia bacterium]|nr:ISKra4 family transposase [Acidimicrobiia bacterium]